MKTFFTEFKEFIARGSVIDLAVGVIIGGALTAVVTSLTDNILMPLILMASGGLDLSNLTITVGSAVLEYGKFIQSIITFLITAFVIFCILKAYNKFLSKKKEAPAPDPQVILLEEIRDLLKNTAKK